MTSAFRPTTLDHLLAIEELRQLTLSYSHAVDSGGGKPRIALFTEDGVWDSSDNGHGRMEGRAALRKFFSGSSGVINMIHHLVLSPLISDLREHEAHGICTYSGQVNFTN